MPNTSAETDAYTLEIVTPNGVALKKEVIFTKLPAENGEVGIYQNHSPSLLKLHAGKVRIQETNGEVHKYFIPSGFTQVLEDKVTILTSYIENADDINTERAKKSKKRALKRLEDSNKDSTIDTRRARRALFRAERRLYVHKISNKKKQ